MSIASIALLQIHNIGGIVLIELAVIALIFIVKKAPKILLWVLSPIWFPFVGCWMLIDSLKRKRRRKQARLKRKARTVNG